jgi:CBS domain-containing protein
VRIAEIMQTDLVAVPPVTTVVEAAGVMKERRVGACLVMEGPELAGIFTERDLLLAFADGLDVRKRPVTELLTRQVTLAPPDAEVVWAADTM